MTPLQAAKNRLNNHLDFSTDIMRPRIAEMKGNAISGEQRAVTEMARLLNENNINVITAALRDLENVKEQP